METLLEQLQRLIKKYMKDNDLSIDSIRKSIAAKQGNPLDVSINTVYAILANDYVPTSAIIKRLIVAVECKYEQDSFGNVTKIIESNE
jgi:hypothetical protein